jgi:hypothetical protein
MIQQLICCLVSAPQPITTLHPLSSCTFIPLSALQIRPYSAFKSLSAILYFLNRFFISRSISVCWLLASGLKIPKNWFDNELRCMSPCSIPDARAAIDRPPARPPARPPCARHAHASSPARASARAKPCLHSAPQSSEESQWVGNKTGHSPLRPGVTGRDQQDRR